MAQPFLFKVFLVTVYTLGLLIPFTGQFVLPATPIFTWLVLFYSSQFIPRDYRPHIWVSVLPTLESVLYGANISDILTRFTNPVLDIVAWIPYGVLHFAIPFVVAAFLFVFSPPGAVKFWGAAFGYVNIVGVMIQILFPCAPPCTFAARGSCRRTSLTLPRSSLAGYELRDGLVPANYLMKGSAGGLARIDKIFGGNGYENTFSNAPVPFGAFPSLHAGCATLEALFLSHFFPGENGRLRIVWWSYVFVLYWSTMYLTHHYLIDVCAGGQLACSFFYFFLSRVPDELRHPTGVQAPYSNGNALPEDPEAALDSRNFGGWGGSVGGDEDNGFELPEANTGLMRDTSIDGEGAPFRSNKAV